MAQPVLTPVLASPDTEAEAEATEKLTEALVVAPTPDCVAVSV